MQDKEIKELIMIAKKQAITNALSDIEQWYDIKNAQHPANNPESKAYKKGWQKGVIDVVYILKQQLESVKVDEINSHMFGEIKLDESKGHKAEDFLAAVDMLNDSKNWTTVGELNETKVTVNKIVKTTHVANFNENGIELTKDARRFRFVDAIDAESINNAGVVSGGDGSGGIVQMFWTPLEEIRESYGVKYEVEAANENKGNESILCGCSRIVKLA